MKQGEVLFLALAAAVGAALGYLGARILLVGSGLSLVPWALVGLGLGAASHSRRQAALLGGVYGFSLAYAFMVSGYDGSASLRSRLLPFLVLGALGALCGLASSMVGRRLRLLVR